MRKNNKINLVLGILLLGWITLGVLGCQEKTEKAETAISTDKEEEEPKTPEAVEWKVPAYDHAKLYLYNLHNDWDYVVRNGKLNESVVKGSERILSTSDAEAVVKAVGHPRSPEIAECFTPHHGVVFYDENDSIVAWTSICLMCLQLRSHPESSIYANIPALERIVRKHNLPVFDRLNEVQRYWLDSVPDYPFELEPEEE